MASIRASTGPIRNRVRSDPRLASFVFGFAALSDIIREQYIEWPSFPKGTCQPLLRTILHRS